MLLRISLRMIWTPKWQILYEIITSNCEGTPNTYGKMGLMRVISLVQEHRVRGKSKPVPAQCKKSFFSSSSINFISSLKF